MYGKIERVWPDSKVFILGGGPSLNQVDLSLLKGRNVLGVNQAFEIQDCEVPFCYCGDRRWYDWNKDRLKEYPGTLVTSYSVVGFPEMPCKNINVQKISQQGIWSKDPSTISWNGNSGATAINVAYWLGAKKIVLLGFDMGHSDGEFNWHNRYPPIKRRPNGFYPNPYRRFLSCWRRVAIDARNLGIEIINSTVGGQLNVFTRKPLEVAL